MADKIFPVDISGISAEALAKNVLSKYLVADPVCSLLIRGVNDTYTVNAKRKRYYLRVYQHGWRSKTEITSELDVLNYLRHHQCPVSYPIKRRDGKYLTRINAPEGIRYAVLFSEARKSWWRSAITDNRASISL